MPNNLHTRENFNTLIYFEQHNRLTRSLSFPDIFCYNFKKTSEKFVKQPRSRSFDDISKINTFSLKETFIYALRKNTNFVSNLKY
jgi:hypothetical protein